ncbi:hypothetical protein GEMRC1_007216 [Eukaryota sp. GEM-RC1]
MEKKLEEEREARRQQRKLNFLLTQTELYSHFMLRKDDQPVETPGAEIFQSTVPSVSYEDETWSEDSAYVAASIIAEKAVKKRHEELNDFAPVKPIPEIQPLPPRVEPMTSEEIPPEPSTSEDPSSLLYTDIEQPRMFNGTLKQYQLKGMNWLVSLYDQGINGILADEMGLGKTIQSIAFLAHLCETRGQWGPFIVIGHSTILHNWQEEISKFAPKMKVVPYWGSPKERKVIRTMFTSKKHVLGKEDSPFHVLVTSYQFAVQDEKFFKRVIWEYMILDEAQAIKCHSSQRWKTLLTFKCRNRLLLTGTPIQNSMIELWSLLHFIMPTLFDSHGEFEEWFAKGIEAQAADEESKETQHLERLHVILKPFMLRREKKDVESELARKIEIVVKCNMSSRQTSLYNALKKGQPLEGLISNSQHGDGDTLLNLVMQLRKVCNHPGIFERREPCFSYNFIDAHPILPSAEPLMGKHSVNYSVSESSSLSTGQGQYRLFSGKFDRNPINSNVYYPGLVCDLFDQKRK